MARPITKAAWQVRGPEEVPRLLREAFALAVAGRPGPVLIDIPMDVQSSEVEGDAERAPDDATHDTGRENAVDEGVLRELFDQLSKARRPLLLVGGGVRASRSTALLRSLVEKIRVPVVNSVMAVDALPFCDPIAAGVVGAFRKPRGARALRAGRLLP